MKIINYGTPIEFKLVICKRKILTCALGKHSGWLRVFGYGVSYKNLKKIGLSFSERNGYTKIIKVGNYSIKKLNRI